MMNIQEFLIALDIEVDKTVDFELPYIQPEQKIYWLNVAQDRVLSQKLFGNNVKGSVYDISQERVDDVRTLISSQSISSSGSAGYGSSSYSFTLPNNYRFFDKFMASTTRIGINGDSYSGVMNMDVITRREIDYYTTTPGINKPELLNLKGFVDGNTLVVISDSYTTVSSGTLKYIKSPNKFTTGAITDLPEHLHQEIVSEAAALILNSFESPRVGVQMELNKTRE